MFARSVWIGVVHVVALSVLLSPATAGLLGTHHGAALSGSSPPLTASTPGTPSVSSPSMGHGPAFSGDRLATQARIMSAIHAAGVPSRDVYLPNFNAEPSHQGNVVGPTYLHSPAPIGIAAMGVANTTGNATGSILNSPSFEGQITFNNLNEFYLDDDSTDYIGAQLNTVVANVTLFGQTNYSFWNQNVIAYSARSNLLQFIDNIWNFSDSSFYLSPNVFNSTSPNGTLVAPAFSYALGPVINITMPFTVSLYINASTTNVNGSPDDIVWFNYSVVKSGASVATGTYDWAIFNSQDPANLLPSIPTPEYQVNGINLSPTGYLPYDAELVFCGPGGGSTTSVYDINATLNLWYLNTSTGLYQNVPSAFAYGTNTGETIEGATEWYDASNTVHVGPGPTLPIALWNGSPTAAPGFAKIHGTVSPDTAFVFLNQSASYNESWWAWAPVAPGGTVDYNVPLGDYSGEVLLANHDRSTLGISAAVPSSWALTVNLPFDASQGYYTPIMAFNNAQLSGFASSGSGTALDPYIVTQTTPALVDPAFGSLNDFNFPVFPGLLFAHTTAYVVVDNGPTFPIQYGGRVLTHLMNAGLPTNNSLQFQLYGTDHVTVWNTTGISGWFDGTNLAGFPIASLMVWNSTNTLIGANQFWDDGTSILLYGGTANTVWGNWFTEGPVAQDPNYNYAVMAGTYAIGPQVYESGDLIFNNAFLTAITAYSPASTIYYETFYSGFNQSWINDWNVPAEPASDVMVVNGINLTGSITGGIFQGGNLWWNYGQYGTYLPFDGYGLIAVGGDYVPLVGDQVTFAETGLPDGTFWSFTVLGMDVGTTSSSVTLALYDGSFPYAADPVGGYTVTSSSGVLDLAGAPSAVVFAFTWAGSFDLTWTESGLPMATLWSVWVGGAAYSSNATTLVVPLSNGTYTWVVAPVAGLYVSPGWGSTVVNGAPVFVTVAFTAPAVAQYTVEFVSTGLPSGTSWSVSVSGSAWTGTVDILSGTEANGSYDYTVGSVAGYVATPLNGTVTVSGATVTVDLTWAAQDGSLLGTVTPATATVFVDGAAVTVASNGSFAAALTPGVHSIVASSTGYLTHFDNVSVSAGAIKVVAIGLTAIPSGGSGSTTSGLTGSDLAVVAGLALLAVLFLIGMTYFWSKSRRPPVMMKPETGSGSVGGDAAPPKA